MMSTNKPEKSDQQRVLDALNKHGPLSRRELSLVTGIPSPNLSSPLERLQKWRLIVIHSYLATAGRRARRYALAHQTVSISLDDLKALANSKVFVAGDRRFISADFKERANAWLGDFMGEQR